jgi:adenylate cyclase class 1
VELLLSDERQEGAETHLIIDQGEVNALTGEVTQSDGIHTLSRGTVGSGETSQIRRSKSFIDLLAWIHFNRIANDSTRFALLPPEGKVEQRELRGLIEALNQIAPNGRLPPMRPEAYANATRIESGVVFVNTGILDPVTRRNRQGIHLSSDKIDLFSYGSRNESLALTFDLLLITSRREVLVHHYEGETALPDLLCDYLGWFAPGEPPLVLDAICMAPERGPLIARRVSELIAHIAAAIENNRAFRYVVRYMQYYYLVQRDEGEIRLRRAVDYPALCDLLSTPAVSAEPIATSGNPWALATTPLPLILTSQTSGRIQFFCKPQGPLAEIYLLDELGSLFRQVMHFDTVELLLSHHHQFFDAVLARRGECEGPEMIDYYEIFQPTKGRYGLRPIEFSHHPPSRKPISLQVIAESLAEDGKSRLSIFCDDVEFCSSEYGGELFDRVARHILDLRRDSARYPIYITDIDINRLINAVPGDGPIQTIHYLIYKKRIEDRLNESLRRI